MKKLLFLMAIMAIFIPGYGQHNKLAGRTDLANFAKSTTYVVTDNNPMLGYDIKIKTVVQKWWKITPYKFITSSEFETLRKNKMNSFILLTRVNLTKDPDGPEYHYLNFLMGDSIGEIKDMPELLTIPLNYSGVDENGYIYKMGAMIRFAQVHIKTLSGAFLLFPYSNLTYYNSNTPMVKTKTLLVELSDLSEDVNSAEKIHSFYPYAVRLVASDSIEAAIDNQTSNTLIMHVVSPGKDDKLGRSYKIIYGADDGKMYYYDYENITKKIPAGFLAKDFQRLTWK